MTKKWEYITIDMPKLSIYSDNEYSLQDALNSSGEKGWEVCGIASPRNLSSSYECFVLKREVVQEYKHKSIGVDFGPNPVAYKEYFAKLNEQNKDHLSKLGSPELHASVANKDASYDPLLKVPDDIVEAERKVSAWFMQNGWKDWALNKSRNRY